MNSSSFRHNVYMRLLIGIRLFSLVTLFFTAEIYAKNWQLVLVPEHVPIGSGFQPQTAISSSYLSIEKGLTLTLSKAETLIDKQGVFPKCQFNLCGEEDIASLMQKIRTNKPQVQLLILYSFGGEQNSTLFVRLLDPISYRVRLTESLSLIDNMSEVSLLQLGQDMGKLIEARLDNLQAQTQFLLTFDGFLFDELNGLTTKILANSGNVQLELKESSVSYLFLEKYFTVSNSQYSLSTVLNANQVEQSLAEYFRAQSLDASITFAQTENKDMQFFITRSSKPYIPLLITLTLFLLGFILALGIYIRRRHLDFCLTEYADNRNADLWLETYKKASFVFFGLRAKWVSRASYWSRLQKESTELASQAKLYFDAGDVYTAKLFLSKSLHANSANLQAKNLVQAIETAELHAKSFSDDEQWIRNRLAKAMNNYRQQQPIKALRQLYQAAEFAQKESSLKTQQKAIKKLIRQIKQEFSTSETSLVINCSSDPQSIVLCQNNTIHLGRRPSNDNITWISAQDDVFYINHKSVSRAGKQCAISRQKDGFFLIDNDSKNGTFINNNQLAPHQPVKVNNADIIHLGGNMPFVSSALKVKLSPKELLLELSIDSQSMTLLDKQELNSVWPDNTLALQSKLLCVHKECWLILHKASQKLHVFEADDLPFQNKIESKNNESHRDRKNYDTKEWIALCAIILGKTSSVRPLFPSNDEKAIKLDGVTLLGEVPLVLPCVITYMETNIQLSAYDSVSIRDTQESFITAPSIVDK